MPVVRIEHKVASFEKWKQVFDSDPVNRKGRRSPLPDFSTSERS